MISWFQIKMFVLFCDILEKRFLYGFLLLEKNGFGEFKIIRYIVLISIYMFIAVSLDCND